jgi:hypothetical protein
MQKNKDHIETFLYPSLFQINTRVYLTGLSKELGRQATLDDIPNEKLIRLKALGFDWIWFLSVWTTGPEGQRISREPAGWRKEFEETLPDLTDDDIGGSGFAIAAYEVSPALGGKKALERLRKRMHTCGLRLMLDFVPNHMGPDHAWVTEHPEFFVSGSEDLAQTQPQNYKAISTSAGESVVLAYGRDPYFDGWPDTFQLDYSNPNTVAAMTLELEKIAQQCDGVRCDMAMLVLPEVCKKTWGREAKSFWPEAIGKIKAGNPDFKCMAEVYWDMEWAMMEQGFDWAYDKRLYDRLCAGVARPVQEHLHAAINYQQKLARFLENHDELRVASLFEYKQHKCAAVITFTIPGLRFFHDGQTEGYTKRISPHLIRRPEEPINPEIEHFYMKLLMECNNPLMKCGEWHCLNCLPAWKENKSNDAFIAHMWVDEHSERIIVANYSPHQSQCLIKIPLADLEGAYWRLHDVMGKAVYDRNGDELFHKGLFLDMQPWQFHVFELKKLYDKD